MISNFEATKVVEAGAGDKVLIIGVREGVGGDLVGGHEVEEGFGMH